MTVKPCPFEESVAAAARSGDWSPEIAAHRNDCLCCAELSLVVAALAIDAEELAGIEAPLPDSGPIWLRARLASRERDYRRATGAIVWVQRATVAAVMAVGLFFVPGLLAMIKKGLAGLEFASPALDLPRTAGSPLLVVVISMLVLGVLAFLEFASPIES